MIDMPMLNVVLECDAVLEIRINSLFYFVLYNSCARFRLWVFTSF